MWVVPSVQIPPPFEAPQAPDPRLRACYQRLHSGASTRNTAEGVLSYIEPGPQVSGTHNRYRWIARRTRDFHFCLMTVYHITISLQSSHQWRHRRTMIRFSAFELIYIWRSETNDCGHCNSCAVCGFDRIKKQSSLHNLGLDAITGGPSHGPRMPPVEMV
ncbi:hypothetical protein B0H11DRAFT_1988209 [Mycena galericulata]|nr:hypothetical protein B0H11DRAFT_1988209 [Mycena galericulata]